MSAAAAPPPATQQAAAPTTSSSQQPAGRTSEQQPAESAPRKAPMGTPKFLQLAMALVVSACLLFGVVAVTTLVQGGTAMAEASRNTRQLLRIQQLQAHLLNADATATNSFLVGGLESPAQRSTYSQAMSEAAKQIIEASDAQPADRQALEQLNAVVIRYSATMEQARANNRQGFPIGSAYLSDASAQLRTEAMPILDSLVEANTSRITSQTRPLNGWLLSAAALLALAAIGWVMFAVAIRFRRIINIGLALAAIGVLLGFIISLITINSAATSVRRVDNGSLATARHTASARVHGYDAKAYESLTLIARDRGGDHERSWQNASWLARQQIRQISDRSVATRLDDAWNQHLMVHRRIRDLDQSGRWDAAVSSATGTELGSSNETFAEFDKLASAVINTAGDRSVSTLGDQRIRLTLVGLLTLVLSIAAAVCGVRGINARRQEYA